MFLEQFLRTDSVLEAPLGTPVAKNLKADLINYLHEYLMSTD
jgi:hypothetical protein